MNEILLSLIAVLLVVIFLMNNKEKFLTYTKATLPMYLDIQHVLNTVCNDINKKNNKKIICNNIENVEYNKNDNRLLVIAFVTDYSSSYLNNPKIKVKFDLNVINNDIFVNNIIRLNSETPMNRSLVNGRGSTVYKTDTDRLFGVNNLSLKFSDVDFENSETRPLNRNKWLFDSNTKKILNTMSTNSPCRINVNTWDKNGIETVISKNIENSNTGVYHGTSQPNFVPSFNPTIFVRNEDSYQWLFDVASDVASRPVGVTSAKGSSA